MEFINSIIEKTNKYLKKLDLCKNNGKPTYILGNGEGADNAQKRAGNFVFSGRLVNKKYYDSNSSALCFEDFLDNFGDKINLVVACRNPDLHLINSYITKIQELLIFDCYSGNYSVDPELMTYDFVTSNIQNLQSIYSELADDYSRKCFSAYINQKISFDFNYLSEVKTQPQYFEELITLNEDEVFVDCGAFDGDSALAFVSEINRRGIEQYNKILCSAQNEGKQYADEVVFCGYGEPMLKFAILKDVCKYLKENYPEIKIRVNTNGHANYVFGKNIVPELKGLVDLFSVSLNGVDEEEYNELSQPKFDGAYEEVKKFIKACADSEIKVVATVVEGYKGHHIDLENCEKIAKELGADFRAREWIPAGYS